MVQKAYDYYPFGLQMRAYQPGDPATFTFTNKQLDEDGGLDWYYFGARFYDAEVGRFLGVDPLAGKYPGLNPYHYTMNNPLIYVDPDGKEVVFAGSKAERQRFNTFVANLRQSETGNALYTKLHILKQKFIFKFAPLPNTVKGRTTVFTSIKLNRKTKKPVAERKLAGSETRIDETKILANPDGATFEGAIAHEMQHISDAVDDPQKFVDDKKAEEKTNYKNRPQEKRAEETRKKVEEELKERENKIK